MINNNEVPWKNPSQNPADLLRPVFLIREIENDQEPLNLVIPTTVYARTNLNENDININYNIHLTAKIYIYTLILKTQWKILN